MKLRELVLHKSLLFYTVIGVSNTLLTMGMEFILNNVFGLPYWWVTSIPFAITSVTSFVFNRRFSFKEHRGGFRTDMLKFYALFIACYLLAFRVAKPLAIKLMSDANASEKAIHNVSIIVGQCVFTPLNYLGQRFLVYRKKQTPPRPEDETAVEDIAEEDASSEE